MANPEIFRKIEEIKPSAVLKTMHISLDTYDDIFSDFDPSSFDRKVLSDDFIKEIRKRYGETKKGEFEINFSIPRKARSAKIEGVIKKRLKEHFQKQLKDIREAVKKQRKKGSVYVGIGAVILLSTLYLAQIFSASQTATLIELILTPFGWFGMWEGIGLVVEASQKHSDQQVFFTKFSKAQYLFVNEEDLLQELAKAEESSKEHQSKIQDTPKNSKPQQPL